jgi:hypothetical protein
MEQMGNGLEPEQDTKGSERNFSNVSNRNIPWEWAYKLMPLIEFTCWEC